MKAPDAIEITPPTISPSRKTVKRFLFMHSVAAAHVFTLQGQSQLKFTTQSSIYSHLTFTHVCVVQLRIDE